VTEPPTDQEILEYTNGGCGQLARALAELTAWQVAVVGVYDEAGAVDMWGHAVVETPSGKYLDVTGIQTAHELLMSWKNWAEAEGVWDELDICPVDDYWLEAPTDDDWVLAQRLLEVYDKGEL
jgi:hypothetical protein